MTSSSSERFLPNNAALGFLEYIFFSHKQDVERAADLVTLALHAVLLSRDLQLVGDTGQMLSKGWAKSDPIRLRYYKQQFDDTGEKINIPPTEKDVVLLCVTETAPNIIMSISTGTKCVGHSVVIEEAINGTVQAAKHKSRYQEAFRDADALIVELESHFIHPLFNRSMAILSSSSGNGNGNESEDMVRALADRRTRGGAGLGFEPGHRPGPGPSAGAGRGHAPRHTGHQTPYRQPPSFDYGRRDLDPFMVGPGFAPGGMLLDPRHSAPRDPHSGQPLPPGAVPAGARFDAFMPPGLGGGRAMPRAGFPDPDAPGGFGFEDMYM